MVIDGRSLANNNGMNCIDVQSGGELILKGSTIVDSGTSNTGILLNNGSTASLYSGNIVYAKTGICVKENAKLKFYNLEDSRATQFWENTTSILFDASFNGICEFNQSNIKLRDSEEAIVIVSNTGTINISNCQIYNNSKNGINFGSGILNISGGSIYNNSTGILLNSNYSGKMTITNVNIYGNKQYAINHSQNEDGNCTILGGTITGIIYLGEKDNYVNVEDKYPVLSITPSTYYLKRKLVKTNSNEIANTEISNVTMTPNGNYYKYVNDEYIVVWKGCNVIINCTDYYGNIISIEVINGNLGETYETTIKEIEGYDLIEMPENAKGSYTKEDITVTYKFDLKNIAQVIFEDLLSGVKSAKYWYNSSVEEFTGDGFDFENNKIFEDYGYYKIIVENNVGLKKELIFILNKDSFVR